MCLLSLPPFQLFRSKKLNSARKGKAMKTFVQTRELFLETLAQLKQLEGPETIIQALRVVKERDTGKLCYQAEEDLPQAELALLKDMLDVRRNKWETYKQHCRENWHKWVEEHIENA
jgi:hypothetical protein